MTITKMDAMRRQVLTAVKLWFDDGDPVAIHTLLFASHEILHTLFRQRGHEHLMFDSPAVRPQYRKEWATALREAGTFFKRARADPTSTLEFNRNLNEMYLLFSIYGLNQMGEVIAQEEQAFMHWMFVNRPEVLNEGAYDSYSIEQIEKLRGVSKKEFFHQAVIAYRIKREGNTRL